MFAMAGVSVFQVALWRPRRSQVERYKYLTSTKERKAIANKILETYIKSTSPRYVNLAGQAVNKIETGMRATSLPADLFDEVRHP